MTDIFLYSGEANPNDLKLRDPTVLAGGGATLTADLAATEPADVAAFSKVRESAGTLAVTEARDAAALVAKRVLPASFSVTESRDVLAFAAGVARTLSATLSGVDDGDAASFTADLAHPASFSLTELIDQAAMEFSVLGNYPAELAAIESQDAAGFDVTLVASTLDAQPPSGGIVVHSRRRKRYDEEEEKYEEEEAEPQTAEAARPGGVPSLFGSAESAAPAPQVVPTHVVIREADLAYKQAQIADAAELAYLQEHARLMAEHTKRKRSAEMLLLFS